MPIVSIVTPLPPETGDGLADNYIPFEFFVGTAYDTDWTIGVNRDDTLLNVVRNTAFDAGVAVSLQLADGTTDYQNLTGRTVYVIVTVTAAAATGPRSYKIWSSPTTNSIVGATQVYDSVDFVTNALLFNSSGEDWTSYLVPIQDNHYAVIENTSAVLGEQLQVQSTNSRRGLIVQPRDESAALVVSNAIAQHREITTEDVLLAKGPTLEQLQKRKAMMETLQANLEK